MLVLGVDPGTAITGIGLVDYDGRRFVDIYHGVIRTSAGLSLDKRLLHLHEELTQIVARYQPDETAVESLFFNKNTRTAMAVGQARGVVLLTAAQNNLPLYEYTPLQVKQAVAGQGRAEKTQIQFMVRALLGLTAPVNPDDAADALALAICHINSKRVGIDDFLHKR